MEASWKFGLEIDRINGSLCYYKENCRWATEEQQQRNKSNVKLSEDIVADIRSSTLTRKALAEKYGVYQETIGKIINNQRWKN